MPARLPSLETLRVFDACARHANFSRAAAELCITPAAVSQRMRGLESDLGRALFVRSGPRLALNGDGERLFARTSAMMALARAAIDEIRSERSLRLTVTPTFAARWLAPRLHDFERRHPDIAIALDVSTDRRDPGAFDLAIRAGDGRWPGTRATPLFAVEATPMLSPHLLGNIGLAEPADLARLPLIASGDWSRWFIEQQIVPPTLPGAERAGYPTQDLAAQAALEGQGVALLSPRLFGADVRSGRLIRPFAFLLSGPYLYWLVEPATGADTGSAAATFRDWLLATITAP